eukprot:2373259-Prymnesium_polylepis.1
MTTDPATLRLTTTLTGGVRATVRPRRRRAGDDAEYWASELQKSWLRAVHQAIERMSVDPRLSRNEGLSRFWGSKQKTSLVSSANTRMATKLPHERLSVPHD